MIVHYLLLIPALLLLWIPRPFLKIGKDVVKERRPRPEDEEDPRYIRSPGDISVRFLEEIVKPRNYMDLLRSLAGGYLLLGTPTWEAAISLPEKAAGVHVSPSLGKELILVRIGIFLIGVILQTIRYDGRKMLFPPIFYVTGIAFAVAGPKAAAFAVILAWLANRALASPSAFFMAFAIFLAGFGFVFNGRDLMVMATCALMIVPAGMSLLSGRALIAMSRRVVREAEE